MRINSGKLKGRIFDSLNGHKTHPMSDKLKSVIFNVLGDIEGLTVLDAFSGTGALAFEALSRGAHHAILLDNDTRAAAVIRKNIVSLNLDKQAQFTQAPVYSWSARNTNKQFDLIFADPPFDDLQTRSIHALTQHLKDAGVLILSFPSSIPAPQLDRVQLVKQVVHANAQLIFYKRI